MLHVMCNYIYIHITIYILCIVKYISSFANVSFQESQQGGSASSLEQSQRRSSRSRNRMLPPLFQPATCASLHKLYIAYIAYPSCLYYRLYSLLYRYIYYSRFIIVLYIDHNSLRRPSNVCFPHPTVRDLAVVHVLEALQRFLSAHDALPMCSEVQLEVQRGLALRREHGLQPQTSPLRLWIENSLKP